MHQQKNLSDESDESAVRRVALVNDLIARLGPVCREWPADIFHAMVESLVEITMKYDGRVTTSIYDRRSTDRMIEELKQALARNEAARQRAEHSDA